MFGKPHADCVNSQSLVLDAVGELCSSQMVLLLMVDDEVAQE